MSLVVTTDGLVVLLAGGLLPPGMSALELRLFKNNYVPLKTSVTDDFEEATFAGYLPVALPAALWIISNNESGDALATRPNVFFVQSASSPACDVYGYFVVRVIDQRLMWAERRDAGPISMDEADKVFPVRPQMILRNIPV